MLETYWNEVFGKYKREDGKFDIPGFPEPLMSKHFGVTNVIGREIPGYKQFWICEFDPSQEKDIEINTEPLSMLNDEFYEFHNLPFLQKLIPFLLTTDIQHTHLFLKDEKGIYASALAGEAKCGIFMFNLLIRPDMRRKGIAKKLLSGIRGTYDDRACLYWTIHKGFNFDARVSDYFVDIC